MGRASSHTIPCSRTGLGGVPRLGLSLHRRRPGTSCCIACHSSRSGPRSTRGRRTRCRNRACRGCIDTSLRCNCRHSIRSRYYKRRRENHSMNRHRSCDCSSRWRCSTCNTRLRVDTNCPALPRSPSPTLRNSRRPHARPSPRSASHRRCPRHRRPPPAEHPCQPRRWCRRPDPIRRGPHLLGRHAVSTACIHRE
jgi:hypothetical protein